MKIIRVGAAALNQTPMDWTHNLANIKDAINKARKAEVSVLCLPELCITGYGCEDAFFYNIVQDRALSMLETIIDLSANMVVSVGLPIAHQGALYNAAALIANKKLLGFVPKQHLAADGVHYEPRWFKRWPAKHVDTTNVRELKDSIGDIIFDVGGVRIGYEICEDAWVADRPGVELAKNDVDIILNPSASHFAFGKHKIRERFVTEGSRAFRCTYLYANLLGNESGRLIFDGDTFIATNGDVVAQGPRLCFSDCKLIYSDIDVDKTRTSQLQNGAFRPSTTRMHEVVSGFDFPTVNHNKIANSHEEGLSPYYEYDEYDEFTHAEALGLFDYMRKSHSNGFVVSLSGGADSAAVACLIRLMCDKGFEELGHDKFISKLGLKGVASFDGCDGDDIHIIMPKLLTCVYQATANSSDTTKNAAQTLATEIGANFMSIDVEDIVQKYCAIGEQFLKTKLNWIDHDTALQNIQARARAPGVWMIANLSNSLLLATSNRSEAAVGYATMDGDTCGGLSPIAGIDKSFLRHWLVRTSHYKSHLQLGNFSKALKSVLDQQPTAELRPADQSQTDEKDLMPYDILNFIEGAAIRDKQGPAEVFARLHERFSTTASVVLFTYVKRFFRLWCQNQWKRERFAIAFHLDDRNLDPKTWCRFPVLSGGFETELAEIENELKQQKLMR